MGQTTPTIRTFIADTNPLFRRGLQALIQQSASLCLVGEAGSGEELSRNLQVAQPDVLIIDRDLLASQDISRLRVAWRHAHPTLQILVLAAKENAHTLEAAMTVGARGYMLKDSKPRDILAALSNIAVPHGKTYSSGMVPDLKALAHHTPETGVAQALTHREKEIVSLLAKGKTVRTVASDLSLSTKTVEAHKLNSMRKLDIHDRASLIAYAARNGIRAAASITRRPIVDRFIGTCELWLRNSQRDNSIT